MADYEHFSMLWEMGNDRNWAIAARQLLASAWPTANVAIWWKPDIGRIEFAAEADMGRHRQGHVSGWRAALLAPVAIPFALLVVLIQRLFGVRRSADLNPVDVARYLSDFLDGSGGEWDWDDFTSISISDLTLDRIRQEAGAVPLPLTTHGEAQLRSLLARVRALEI